MLLELKINTEDEQEQGINLPFKKEDEELKEYRVDGFWYKNGELLPAQVEEAIELNRQVGHNDSAKTERN